jgi:hypothetical protein
MKETHHVHDLPHLTRNDVMALKVIWVNPWNETKTQYRYMSKPRLFIFIGPTNPRWVTTGAL